MDETIRKSQDRLDWEIKNISWKKVMSNNFCTIIGSPQLTTLTEAAHYNQKL